MVLTLKAEEFVLGVDGCGVEKERAKGQGGDGSIRVGKGVTRGGGGGGR